MGKQSFTNEIVVFVVVFVAVVIKNVRLYDNIESQIKCYVIISVTKNIIIAADQTLAAHHHLFLLRQFAYLTTLHSIGGSCKRQILMRPDHLHRLPLVLATAMLFPHFLFLPLFRHLCLFPFALFLLICFLSFKVSFFCSFFVLSFSLFLCLCARTRVCVCGEWVGVHVYVCACVRVL